ncbi:major facilitator superfamily domain-containing protein 6-like isoform X1 [Branchiostoma floridae]|uniref:Major facilitator superfamily domain-containing protein 6-like isoform X1 n=1 Tax=Branchiostoma floridae TaxID=7739 RepID=A0A9J7HFG1_BRAFL|nr:major facilitator superfamily domain-containing protein 6-like isoform X1 [Branchiostoma floridae]
MFVYDILSVSVQREESRMDDKGDLTPCQEKGAKMTEAEEDSGNETSDDTATCTPEVDKDLLVSKSFYFLFFSAYGSLFPLLAVYFKQLGMSAPQSGVLMGVRPFVEFCSCLLWGVVADRWRKGKAVLLLSIACWIAFTSSIVLVAPGHRPCQNDTDESSDYSDPWAEGLTTSSAVFETVTANPSTRAGATKAALLTQNPVKIAHLETAFWTLLALVVCGEFFSAPAITMADSATLGYLGNEVDRYGYQRMFGSLGWGLAMFVIGIILDHIGHHTSYCDTAHNKYTVCFVTFAVLMMCALVVATQFRFHYHQDEETIPLSDFTKHGLSGRVNDGVENKTQRKHLRRSNSFKDITGIGLYDSDRDVDLFQSDSGETLANWREVFAILCDARHGSVLFVAWVLGFGMGLVFTFLFWHLHDLGGTYILFGIASALNHISEITAYLVSYWLISHLGHVKILCLGLAGTVVRFITYSFLTNPWLVLPLELLQGVTHASIWAACTSYIGQTTPSGLRSSAQGILQGVHHGLGRGCGSVIGGVLVHHFGADVTFCAFGSASFLVLVLFSGLHWFILGRNSTNKEKDPMPAKYMLSIATMTSPVTQLVHPQLNHDVSY